MNAPERIGLPDALATLSICYAPLIDKLVAWNGRTP